MDENNENENGDDDADDTGHGGSERFLELSGQRPASGLPATIRWLVKYLGTSWVTPKVIEACSDPHSSSEFF